MLDGTIHLLKNTDLKNDIVKTCLVPFVRQTLFPNIIYLHPKREKEMLSTRNKLCKKFLADWKKEKCERASTAALSDEEFATFLEYIWSENTTRIKHEMNQTRGSVNQACQHHFKSMYDIFVAKQHHVLFFSYNVILLLPFGRQGCV